jgi:hypothetical protein
MNAKELVIKGSEKVVAYVCDKCGLVYSDIRNDGREFAERCCKDLVCGCGQPARKGWTVCETCQAKQDREREEDDYNKAEKILLKDYAIGVFYRDDFPGEGYIFGVDALNDYLDELDPAARPKYAWACIKKGFPHIDAGDLVDGYIDDFPEGVIDDLDLNSLQDFLDGWGKEQKVEYYCPDSSRVVILEGGESK